MLTIAAYLGIHCSRSSIRNISSISSIRSISSISSISGDIRSIERDPVKWCCHVPAISQWQE